MILYGKWLNNCVFFLYQQQHKYIINGTMAVSLKLQYYISSKHVSESQSLI